MLLLASIAVIASTGLTEVTEAITTPAVRIEEARDGNVQRVAIAYQYGRDHVRMSITLDVTTTQRRPTEIEVPIEIPRDAAVIDLELAIGDGTPLGAELRGANTARESYEGVVRRMMDPALLEWSHTTDTHHRVQLRVFPVTSEISAKVTLEVIAPYAAPIEAGTAIVQQTITKTKAHAPSLTRRVGRQLSLVATEPNARRAR
jgi:hypothetical protein